MSVNSDATTNANRINNFPDHCSMWERRRSRYAAVHNLFGASTHSGARTGWPRRNPHFFVSSIKKKPGPRATCVPTVEWPGPRMSQDIWAPGGVAWPEENSGHQRVHMIVIWTSAQSIYWQQRLMLASREGGTWWVDLEEFHFLLPPIWPLDSSNIKKEAKNTNPSDFRCCLWKKPRGQIFPW